MTKMPQTYRKKPVPKAKWIEDFKTVIARSPKIKDPAYVEWLAALSYTAHKEGISVVTLAEKLELHRAYIYNVLRGEYVARQDTLERGAQVAGMDIVGFRQLGRELLGGEDAINAMLKRIRFDTFVVAVDAEGKLLTAKNESAALEVNRNVVASWWGQMDRLAVFMSPAGTFLVSTDRTAKKSPLTLVADASRSMKVVKRSEIQDSETLLAAVTWMLPSSLIPKV